MNKVPVSTIVPFGLRLQPELKARLEDAAAANSRSLNAEIAARLEASLQGRGDVSLPETSTGEIVNELLRRFPPNMVEIRLGQLTDSEDDDDSHAPVVIERNRTPSPKKTTPKK